MKIVLQRVLEASVKIKNLEVAKINQGFLLLLGIVEEDTKEDIDWLCRKVVNLRVFPDENDIMNNSILEANGDIIVVSQFTLHASTKKGNRPSYIKAAKPNVAIPLYLNFVKILQTELGKKIQTGEFGADMKIHLINDGPVTIIMDSKNRE